MALKDLIAGSDPTSRLIDALTSVTSAGRFHAKTGLEFEYHSSAIGWVTDHTAGSVGKPPEPATPPIADAEAGFFKMVTRASPSPVKILVPRPSLARIAAEENFITASPASFALKIIVKIFPKSRCIRDLK